MLVLHKMLYNITIEYISRKSNWKMERSVEKYNNNLPNDDEVNIKYLNEALKNMTNSYKFFCFKAIYDEVILDNYIIVFRTLTCRMLENV